MKFARDGYPVIISGLFIALLVCFAGFWMHDAFAWMFYLTSFLLAAFVLYFFRDPDRVTPGGDHLLIAPADGKVIIVREVLDKTYIQGPANQISIFLSPLDVHVNRIPVSGILEYVKYFPGKYLVAWHEKSSELNERAEFGVRHNSGVRVLFRQIAGFMARRIVFHVSEGDRVVAGHRFGIMKFGSRMDILIPESVQLKVKVNDKVVAGETVLGIIAPDRQYDDSEAGTSGQIKDQKKSE